jgi:hypothetical protein
MSDMTQRMWKRLESFCVFADAHDCPTGIRKFPGDVPCVVGDRRGVELCSDGAGNLDLWRNGQLTERVNLSDEEALRELFPVA